MANESADLPAEAIDALWRGNKIEAIKIVRRARNLDLKDAKTKVDEYVRNNPLCNRSWPWFKPKPRPL